MLRPQLWRKLKIIGLIDLVRPATLIISSSVTGLVTKDPSDAVQLQLGWAIPKRCDRRLSKEQKSLLNKIFDERENVLSMRM